MSLINDALKRASQVQRERSGLRPSPPPFQSCSAQRPATASWLPWVLGGCFGLALLGLGALGGWFLLERIRPQPVQAKAPPALPVSEDGAAKTAPPVSGRVPPTAATARVPTSPDRPAVVSTRPAGPVAVSGTEAPAPRLAVSPPSSAPLVNPASPQASPPTVERPQPAAAPPPPPFPALKLQGIFFRTSKPTALLNGKEYGVGERLGEVEILKIERERVTLSFRGQVQTLQLP